MPYYKREERPLWLYPQPALVEMIAVSPAGAPLRFRSLPQFGGCPALSKPAAYFTEYSVGRSWGPERIETGWWRGGLVRRDYYHVETPRGQRFWLFHDLHGGSWFLHGEFE